MLALVTTISLVGVLKILLFLAVIVFFFVGLKWLAAQMGWTVPQPFWAILGFIVLLLILIWFLTGGVVIA